MVRYLIKFTKNSEIKFISHLDIMRTIQRMITRSELPVEFSQGFNPHMSLSIAQPLPVGVYSSGEYMDIALDREVEENIIVEKLNKSAPIGIKILKAVKIRNIRDGEKKIPPSMASIDGAKYSINIRYINTVNLEDKLNKMLNEDEWIILKKTKTSETNANIKPFVKEFKYNINENSLNLVVAIACGSRENLSADLLCNFIKNYTGNYDSDAFVDIERLELYAIYENAYVPLDTYYKGR